MPRILALALAVSLAAAAPTLAQDDGDLLSQAQTAARGVFQLCLSDAPDAARVAEHGEIWGWPHFAPWLEHPEGYQREAGGESRRDFGAGDKTAYVEVTVQSGQVTEAAPAHVHYFRCNVASDQAVGADLATYFTGLYGQPASKTDAATVWLSGAAAGQASDDDAGALKAVVAAGGKGVRVELTREHGLDRAKLTQFEVEPAA